MASNTCCFVSSNIFLPPSSLTTTCSSSLSPVVFSGGLKSRRGSWVVTRAVPGPNTYIFAFVFPLSLLVATIFTTLRISDKLDEDFLQEDNPPLPAVSLVRGRRYSRGSPQMLDASLSPDKEPLPDCRTSDPKLLGAKCRILQSLPTRTPVDYRDRAPKAHTRFHPTFPMRTPIDYRRRPSVQAYPWRSLTTDTAFPVDMLQEGVLQKSTCIK
ncbi:hypothetical protein AgCh_013193 [Apium graveolens]